MRERGSETGSPVRVTGKLYWHYALFPAGGDRDNILSCAISRLDPAHRQVKIAPDMFSTTHHSHRARLTLWLAALALLYAAMSPTLNVLRAKMQGRPQLFAELCTRMGIVKVAIPGEMPTKPGGPSAHSPECSMCLPAGTWLGMAGADTIFMPTAIGCHEAPSTVVSAPPFLAAHTIAWSRAPPGILLSSLS